MHCKPVFVLQSSRQAEWTAVASLAFINSMLATAAKEDNLMYLTGSERRRAWRYRFVMDVVNACVQEAIAVSLDDGN